MNFPMGFLSLVKINVLARILVHFAESFREISEDFRIYVKCCCVIVVTNYISFLFLTCMEVSILLTAVLVSLVKID